MPILAAACISKISSTTYHTCKYHCYICFVEHTHDISCITICALLNLHVIRGTLISFTHMYPVSFNNMFNTQLQPPVFHSSGSLLRECPVEADLASWLVCSLWKGLLATYVHILHSAPIHMRLYIWYIFDSTYSNALITWCIVSTVHSLFLS